MKVAAFIGEAQDFGGAVLYNGYFCYPMMYQGERQVVFCRVRRDMNSNKLYVHEVFTEDEIKDNSFQTVAQSLNSKPHGGNVLYKSILTDFLNKDNTVSKMVDENGEPLRSVIDKAESFHQRAWVGSAADFDKLDLGYVGTGEGAQVHGWGLYFAQRREVAEGYRKKLSNSLTIIYDGKKQEDITGDIKDAIQPFSMQLKKPSDLKDVSDEHPSERKENEKGVSSQRIRVIDPGEGRKTPFLDHRLAGGLSVVKDCL